MFIMLLCIGCQWQLKPSSDSDTASTVSVVRYDRIESLYLTTGDYSAMQQMNTYYPTHTRMLIENVLQLGKVNDRDINTKFLYFFQDSTLQHMLSDVQRQYADMDDINQELNQAFTSLREHLPGIDIPEVYAQIGSFDQSIIVGDGTLGISLDKYLGADYPFYVDHYSEGQRRLMTRQMIVPDCLSFYILSIFHLPHELSHNAQARDIHMGRIQWTVNLLLNRSVFSNSLVDAAASYMSEHSGTTLKQLLQDYDVTFQKND